MKHITRIIAISLALFIGCAFTLPAQIGMLESHAASKIKINKTKATITKGDTLQLKITGTKKKAKWSSSKKSVATVSNKGKVTGKSTGTASITAKVGEKKYTCKVTVKKPNYKKLIVGMWGGPWDGGQAEFEFTKSGYFYFSSYNKYGDSSTEGYYWVKGNKLELDTGEIYTIKSIKNGVLTIKTYLGTNKLQRLAV